MSESDYDMSNAAARVFRPAPRPPIAILGVPFDNVTKAEAISLVEQMIASRQPHYVVTPNVDFLVQARRDVELRRILFEAHLVLCDGTPLVWASRLLGNALPERVAGADLVPLLVQIAAQKQYRIFLLGATPESARRAVSRLKTQYPGILIAGHYSPPFSQLLEMDHEEIKRRIREARPDLLFVSFGCPKQEKWVAMHYRKLAVPVTAGVGATIDFLAGQVKRAPVWMQRSGTEWIFRLGQEPRRLFRRYVTDLWVFGTSILPQWWELRIHCRRNQRRRSSVAALTPPLEDQLEQPSGPDCSRCVPRLVPPAKDENVPGGCLSTEEPWVRVPLPDRLDFTAVSENPSLVDAIADQGKHCVLEMSSTRFIDSTGVGFLIRLQKKLRGSGRELFLLSPSAVVLRALALMRLEDFFQIACDEAAVRRLLMDGHSVPCRNGASSEFTESLHWRGEVTAANAENVWAQTQEYLVETVSNSGKIIDLSEVRFIDSTGLGLMIRAKKLSLQREEILRFSGLQPPVRNVLRLSRVEEFLLGRSSSNGRALSGHA
jgi:N-acetylglucosaminyldiphosphoundecaprenol N-acetyl-beta-D-mannosaminyltransferase